MSMTPERRVKAAVSKILKQYNMYCFSPVTGGFGRSGVPDIVVCINGHFVGIECKAGKNKPTELQKREMDRIQQAGGYAIVINEDNQHELIELLDKLTR